MTAIAWLLLLIGIGAVIEGYHGHGFWQPVQELFSGKVATS